MFQRVLIIGAGIAGLSAARALLERGLQVAVIEARPRTGGRIHSRKDGFPGLIEEGAEFMHGEQPLTIQLLKESGTGKLLLSGKRYQVWDGRLGDGDFFSNGWNDLLKALARVREDVSMARFLEENFSDEKYRDLRRKVKAFAEGYDGAALERVSTLALREEWSNNDEEHQYQIEGGYSRLITWLEKQIRQSGGKVIISSPVNRISWSPDSVEVHCTTGEVFHGERAIVTVPIGVLQKRSIAFSPAIPAWEEAFQNIGFGGVVKVFAAFRSPFWESQCRRIKDVAFIFSDAPVPTWWHSPSDDRILTGWLAGPRANASLGRDEMYARSLKSLAYIFDCDEKNVADQLLQWDMMNWCADPFTWGAYAYPTTRTASALEVLSTPVEQTIYFTGEGLYHGTAIGTVEAALDSAQQCVARMVKSE